MACTHCTGPGTGTGRGGGEWAVLYTAQGTGPATGQGIVKTYCPVQDPVPDPVVKWVWNPMVPVPVPSPGLGAVCTVHSIIYKPSFPSPVPCSVYTGRERLIRSHSSARFCFELSGNSN